MLFLFLIFTKHLQLSQIDRYNKAYNQTLIETARNSKLIMIKEQNIIYIR